MRPQDLMLDTKQRRSDTVAKCEKERGKVFCVSGTLNHLKGEFFEQGCVIFQLGLFELSPGTKLAV